MTEWESSRQHRDLLKLQHHTERYGSAKEKIRATHPQLEATELDLSGLRVNQELARFPPNSVQIQPHQFSKNRSKY